MNVNATMKKVDTKYRSYLLWKIVCVELQLFLLNPVHAADSFLYPLKLPKTLNRKRPVA